MTAQYTDILVEQPDPRFVIATLNRPDRRNALSDAMFRDLATLRADVASRSGVRALIITGAGEGFCAGLDLDLAAGLPDLPAADYLAKQEQWAASITGLHALDIPVIAAVEGAAAGAGFSLALASDIRIAGATARFNAAFIRVGLSAGDCGASWFLPRIVGHGRAAEIFLTGRFVGAAEAEHIGLVTEAVAEGSALQRAVDLAEAIAANSPFGVRMTKQILSAGATSLREALAVENRTQTLATRTDDMREAVAAFREKRIPQFTGR